MFQSVKLALSRCASCTENGRTTEISTSALSPEVAVHPRAKTTTASKSSCSVDMRWHRRFLISAYYWGLYCWLTTMIPAVAAAVMHTYYEPVLAWDAWNQQANDRALLHVWQEAWKSVGFTVRILTEADARAHPDYASFNATLSHVPLGTNAEYDRSCYLRHLAMAAAGGGWLSDFDTMPLHLKPRKRLPSNGKYTVYENFVPSLVSAKASEWHRMAWNLVQSGAKERSMGNPDALWSDMFALQELQGVRGNYISKYAVLGLDSRPGVGHALFSGGPDMCRVTTGMAAAHFSHYSFVASNQNALNRAAVIYESYNAWRAECL